MGGTSDSTADVGCFPSYREPFGLVFIESSPAARPSSAPTRAARENFSVVRQVSDLLAAVQGLPAR